VTLQTGTRGTLNGRTFVCRTLICSLLLTLGSLSSSAGDKKDKDKAKPEAAQAVDSGSFGIFIRGQRVATETFHIQQQGGNSVITSQLKETGGTSRSEMQSGDHLQR